MALKKIFFIFIVALLLASGVLSLVLGKFPLLNSTRNASPLYVGPDATHAGTTVTPLHGFRIVNIYPHDPEAFTQGLVFHKGHIYEGTGLYGHSTLRKVELATGKIVKVYHLPAKYFGEGITICRNKLVQLTWQSKTGFIYDPQSFRILGKFAYPTEGWGITCDGNNLIMSDGTAILRFLDPRTFKVVKQIKVMDRGKVVPYVNELEYVKGEIYANIWDTGYIARISPQTGQVIGWIDLRGLYSHVTEGKEVDVLNGIAYDAKNERLFVTGKFWPKLFEIKLVR
jgi:glutamine cyclotransferase